MSSIKGIFNWVVLLVEGVADATGIVIAFAEWEKWSKKKRKTLLACCITFTLIIVTSAFCCSSAEPVYDPLNDENPFDTASLYYAQKNYGNCFKALLRVCGSNGAACSNMGFLYSKGLGVDRDADQARVYYEKAVMLGNEQALLNLIAWHAENPYDINELVASLPKGRLVKNNQIDSFVAYCYARTILCWEGNIQLSPEEVTKYSEVFFNELADHERMQTIKSTLSYRLQAELRYEESLSRKEGLILAVATGDPIWVWDSQDLSFRGSFKTPYKIYRVTLEFASLLVEEYILK